MSYEYIINPLTNRKVSIYSKKGVSIIKHYLNQSGGDGNCAYKIYKPPKKHGCLDVDGNTAKSQNLKDSSKCHRNNNNRCVLKTHLDKPQRGRPSYEKQAQRAKDYYGEYDSIDSLDETIKQLSETPLRNKKYRHCAEIEKGDVRTCLTSREKIKPNRGKPCYYNKITKSCRAGLKDELRDTRKQDAEQAIKSRIHRGLTRSAFKEAARRHGKRETSSYDDPDYYPSDF